MDNEIYATSYRSLQNKVYAARLFQYSTCLLHYHNLLLYWVCCLLLADDCVYFSESIDCSVESVAYNKSTESYCTLISTCSAVASLSLLLSISATAAAAHHCTSVLFITVENTRQSIRSSRTAAAEYPTRYLISTQPAVYLYICLPMTTITTVYLLYTYSYKSAACLPGSASSAAR